MKSITLLVIKFIVFGTAVLSQFATAQSQLQTPSFECTLKDIDQDDDGLIEICNLEGLNAIRYQLDGSGYRASTDTDTIKITTGCDEDGEGICIGYELINNLDFTDPNSYRTKTVNVAWTTGKGWEPIGDAKTPFLGNFEGNGYSISNLTINRNLADIRNPIRNYIGLFGQVGNLVKRAKITNVGLLNIDITATENSSVGGLVGHGYYASINNSYAIGKVEGYRSVGGLVGFSDISTVADSYASVDVTARTQQAGGLVGTNYLGNIADSYATGCVIGEESVGGLVGITLIGKIKNSYTRGCVNLHEPRTIDGGHFLGGLVGRRATGKRRLVTPIDASYREKKQGSKIRDLGNTVLFYRGGLSADEIKSPTATVGIYSKWKHADWDFGTSEQYPILNYTSECTEGTTRKDTDPPLCGMLLPDQGIGLRDLDIPKNQVIWNYDFSSARNNYTLGAYEGVESIDLKLRAYNPEAVITVNGADTAIGTTTISVRLTNFPTILTINVVDTAATIYTITIQDGTTLGIQNIEITPINRDGTANEGDTITLTPSAFGGSENYRYTWTQTQGTSLGLSGQPQNTPALTLKIPENFIGSDLTHDVAFELTIDDGDSIASRSEVLTVKKIDNGIPDIDVEVSTASLIVTVGDDPDGNGGDDFIYLWERRELNNRQWTKVSAATLDTFTVPTDTVSGSRYRLEVTHTDAQGHTTATRAGPFRTEVDDDDDGLIEIHYLEDLDAIRHQLDGSGHKLNTKTKITAGCDNDADGSGVCRGYELARELDFNEMEHYTDIANMDKWRNNSGWQPIGSVANPFTATFAGNDKVIDNLLIRRLEGYLVALFSVSTGTISGLRLRNADIKGGYTVGSLVADNRGIIVDAYAEGVVEGIGEIGGLVGNNRGRIINSRAEVNVKGNIEVGGLAAINEDSIIGSYADGNVSGNNDIHGLIFERSSEIGGLVGSNKAFIANSYTIGNVSGNHNIGGLVGLNNQPLSLNDYLLTNKTVRIVNSYAASNVIGIGEDNRNIGGLIGFMKNTGSIRNTYTLGNVSGNHNIGGLVGAMENGTLANSYTVSLVSGNRNIGGLIGTTSAIDLVRINENSPIYWMKNQQSSLSDIGSGDVIGSDYGRNRTANELKSPTTATGIYRRWSTSDWDFGTNKEYPILKHGNGYITNPACDTDSDTLLPDCEVILSNQYFTLSSLKIEARNRGNNFTEVELSRTFNSEIFNYIVELDPNTTVVRLTPTVNDSNVDIKYKIGTTRLKTLAEGASFRYMPIMNNTTIVIRVIPKDTLRSTMRATKYTIDLSKVVIVGEEPELIKIRAKVFLEGLLR